MLIIYINAVHKFIFILTYIVWVPHSLTSTKIFLIGSLGTSAYELAISTSLTFSFPICLFFLSLTFCVCLQPQCWIKGEEPSLPAFDGESVTSSIESVTSSIKYDICYRFLYTQYCSYAALNKWVWNFFFLFFAKVFIRLILFVSSTFNKIHQWSSLSLEVSLPEDVEL